MAILTTRAGLRGELQTHRARGARIGFVPTMGALHEGHLALCDRARAVSDLVVVSIFVNPLQFGPAEDFARYPRSLERDAALLATRGVELVFAPAVEEVYPAGPPRVYVTAPSLADRLCGAFRPGHFDGVLTVVAKLFHLVDPDVAVFGRKDLQQAALVRRMVLDLDLPVEIEVAPIVRDPDGLALSSRNAYLSPAERDAARALPRALFAARDAWRAGEQRGDGLVAAARAVLDAEPGLELQYLELVDAASLEPLARAHAGAALAAAAHAGRTRLIDNVLLEDEP